MVGTVSWQGGTVIEEGLVITVPLVDLDWESIGGVRSALMVSVNYFDVFENIRRVHFWIFSGSDMRHIAPVVRSWVKVSYKFLFKKQEEDLDTIWSSFW